MEITADPHLGHVTRIEIRKFRGLNPVVENVVERIICGDPTVVSR
jgi:hypothetical protein